MATKKKRSPDQTALRTQTGTPRLQNAPAVPGGEGATSRSGEHGKASLAPFGGKGVNLDEAYRIGPPAQEPGEKGRPPKEKPKEKPKPPPIKPPPPPVWPLPAPPPRAEPRPPASQPIIQPPRTMPLPAPIGGGVGGKTYGGGAGGGREMTSGVRGAGGGRVGTEMTKGRSAADSQMLTKLIASSPTIGGMVGGINVGASKANPAYRPPPPRPPAAGVRGGKRPTPKVVAKRPPPPPPKKMPAAKLKYAKYG